MRITETDVTAAASDPFSLTSMNVFCLTSLIINGSFDIPEKSIIYCDPPYKGTSGYGAKFEYDKFYDWCFSKKDEGHKVYISEYSMPTEFKCVWSMDVSNSLDRYSEKRKKRKECLFTI